MHLVYFKEVHQDREVEVNPAWVAYLRKNGCHTYIFFSSNYNIQVTEDIESVRKKLTQ